MGTDHLHDRGVDALAAYLASLHPAWSRTPWAHISEETRRLFRDEARQAVTIYESHRYDLDRGFDHSNPKKST